MLVQLGPDVASVDGLGDRPDWSKAKWDGHAQFVILRATYGSVPDSKYKQYAAQLQLLNIPFSAYGFLRFGANMPSPETQGHALLDQVGTISRRRFPPAIDVEGSRGGLTSAEQLDWVIRAATTVRNGIGAWPLLYTSRVYWIDPAGLSNLHAPELAECLGWWKHWPYPEKTAAHYDPNEIAKLAEPPCPPPWGNQWGVHQFQGDALHYPGLINTCDINRVHVSQQNDSNDTVRWIQRRAGGLIVDGQFGPKTAMRIAEIQKDNGLVVDSIVGLATMSVLCWMNQPAPKL
jgi:hypothetical protein